MTTIPYHEPEQGWDDESEDALPPRRPRRVLWSRATGALLAAIACAVAFYVGIQVEKNQVSPSASTGVTLPAGLRSAAASAATGSGAGAGAGFAGRSGFAGATGAAGGGTFGTVASVSGKTIYVTAASGNTVKVTLSSVTKVTKNLGVSRHSLRPGDTVVVQGVTGAKGAVSATSVSDSGTGTARGTFSPGGTTGASGAGTGSRASGGSAVNSLFGSGG